MGGTFTHQSGRRVATNYPLGLFSHACNYESPPAASKNRFVHPPYGVSERNSVLRLSKGTGGARPTPVAPPAHAHGPHELGPRGALISRLCDRFRSLVLVVADERERNRIAAACAPDTVWWSYSPCTCQRRSGLLRPPISGLPFLTLDSVKYHGSRRRDGPRHARPPDTPRLALAEDSLPAENRSFSDESSSVDARGRRPSRR
jgi:hypothetical protein